MELIFVDIACAVIVTRWFSKAQYNSSLSPFAFIPSSRLSEDSSSPSPEDVQTEYTFTDPRKSTILHRSVIPRIGNCRKDGTTQDLSESGWSLLTTIAFTSGPELTIRLIKSSAVDLKHSRPVFIEIDKLDRVYHLQLDRVYHLQLILRRISVLYMFISILSQFDSV